MPIQRCADVALALKMVERLQAEQGSALFLFFGSEDPGTGQSWCPDCVTADPVLRSACVRLAPQLTLFECPVGERAAWKGQMEHPFRVHPLLRLQRIPTLIRVHQGREVGRLVEADCAQSQRVAAFLGPIHG